LSNRVKLIVDKVNGSQDFATIKQAVVKREGKRSVDHATITVSAKHDIEENDTVSYMQDEVDTTFLTGIWNFQGSCKDESGNNLNGTGNADYRYPNVGTNIRKFAANYALQFDAAGEEITISDNTLLDFTKQFDIIIAFTMESNNPNQHFNGSSNTTQMLFSKHDGTNGVEIGIKYLSTSARWVIYAKLDSTTFTGDASIHADIGTINQNTPRFIRFYRDENNKVRLSLDDVTDGTNCVQTVAVNSTRTTTNLYFGSDRTQAMDFDGIIHQIRIYTGGYLNVGDNQRLIYISPQPMTVKFVGKVTKVQDNFDTKKLSCRGTTKFILENQLSAITLDNTITSATTNEPATHTKNIFDEGQTASNIIKTILYHIDSNFIWNKAFTTASKVLTGKYTATGGFLNSLELLSTLDTKTFFTLPTKVLVYEKHDGIPTPYTFDHNEFIITERGKNSVKLKNDFEIVGRLQTQYKEQSFGNVSSGTVSTLSFAPDRLTLVDNSGTIINTGYTIDLDGKEINWTSTHSGVTAKYWYEKISGSTSDVLYYRVSSSNSTIASTGRNSKRLYIPQLTHRSDLVYYGDRLKTDLESTNNRYRLIIPYLLNNLRENHEITLNNSVMKFGSSTTVDTLVKSIEWRYPEGTTIIDCGEYDLGMFDMGANMATDITSLAETTTITKDSS
jgi:hypothetical protein